MGEPRSWSPAGYLLILRPRGRIRVPFLRQSSAGTPSRMEVLAGTSEVRQAGVSFANRVGSLCLLNLLVSFIGWQHVQNLLLTLRLKQSTNAMPLSGRG